MYARVYSVSVYYHYFGFILLPKKENVSEYNILHNRYNEVLLLSSQVRVIDAAKNLDVVVDSQLSRSAHVAAVCCSGYTISCSHSRDA